MMFCRKQIFGAFGPALPKRYAGTSERALPVGLFGRAASPKPPLRIVASYSASFLHGKTMIVLATCLMRMGVASTDSAGALSSSTTWNFPIQPASLAPTVTFDEKAATLVPGVMNDGVITWKAHVGSQEVGSLQISGASPTRLSESLTANESGTFKFGLFFTVPKRARILDLDCTEANEHTPALEKFYPYNWNLRLDRGQLLSEHWMNVTDRALVDLDIPGFESGGVYYAKESWRLAQISFQGVPEGVRIGFTHNREINQGHDTITTAIPLVQGATETMGILAAPSMHELLVARFGKPNPVTGRLTFIYHKGWISAEPECNMTPGQYNNLAAKLQGCFDLALIRSWQPHASIAAAFNSRGMAAYYYWLGGAVRRTTHNTIPPLPDNSWLLKDTRGTVYTAPRVDVPERPASWPLLNIRKREVRDYLIGRQVAAIKAGYQGVFLDSPYYYVGSDGYVGGNDLGATDSWAYARDLLYKETKAAITKINPQARLAMLGNMYVDFQFLADWVYNENYANSWADHGNDDNPYERILDNNPDHPRLWDRTYRQYMACAYMLGQKGENPLVVGTWLNWGHAPLDCWFTEDNQIAAIKDSYTHTSDALANILRAVSQYARSPRGTTIQAMTPPNATIRTYGPSIVSVSEPTTLNLTADSPMLNLATLAITTGTTQKLNAIDRYIIAERHEPNLWNWSGYGFAYLNAQNYFYGDSYLLEQPTGAASAEMKFVVQTSPGPVTQGQAPAHNGAFKTHTMNLHLQKVPSEIRIIGAKGEVASFVPSPTNGLFAVTLPSKPDFGTYTVELR